MEGLKQIIISLKSNSTLIYLDICFVLKFSLLKKKQKQKLTILFLNLAGNRIGVDGSILVSELLVQNNDIEILKIGLFF